MIRRCACGNVIRLRDSICKECREKYGNISTEWPEWMRYLVSEEQKAINDSRRHDFDLIYNDEYFYRNPKNRNRLKSEKSFEDMFWDNQ